MCTIYVWVINVSDAMMMKRTYHTKCWHHFAMIINNNGLWCWMEKLRIRFVGRMGSMVYNRMKGKTEPRPKQHTDERKDVRYKLCTYKNGNLEKEKILPRIGDCSLSLVREGLCYPTMRSHHAGWIFRLEWKFHTGYTAQQRTRIPWAHSFAKFTVEIYFFAKNTYLYQNIYASHTLNVTQHAEAAAAVKRQSISTTF